MDKKVADCDSSYLATLKTLRQPQQPMPRLSELLHYLGHPENEGVWLLLDVKVSAHLAFWDDEGPLADIFDFPPDR